MTPDILNQVPWETAMPAGPQHFFIILNSVILIAAVVFIFLETRRRNDLVPVYLLLGAGVAIFYEPLGDMLVSALYPKPGQITWISTFGRDIPVFIGILYFWYMSVPALYFLRALEKGLTRNKLWVMFAITFVFATAYEMLGVNMGAWLYYGDHAFTVLGVPLWAPATYAGFSFALCAGVTAFIRNFDAKYHWLLIAGVPFLLAGSHCVLALPAATGMFTETTTLGLYASASLSIILSVAVVWVISLVWCGAPENQHASNAILHAHN